MWRILHLGSHRQALKLGRQNVKHLLARDERCCPQWHRELISGLIIIPDGLAGAVGHLDSVKGGDAWRVVIVQRGIDVPTVEPGVPLCFVFLGDTGLVEGRVRGVFEGGGGESFVIGYSTIADELYLGYTRDCLEIWVKDGLLGGLCLVIAVTVRLRFRVKRLGG